MIGSQYQSKSYGRKALKAIEEFVKPLEVYEKIISDFVIGNASMNTC